MSTIEKAALILTFMLLVAVPAAFWCIWQILNHVQEDWSRFLRWLIGRFYPGAADKTAGHVQTAKEPEGATPPATRECACTAPNRPADKAFRAYWIRELMGVTNQTDIAEKMTQMGVKATQGQVSRWLTHVEAYQAAGGIAPDLKILNAPQSIDPDIIDMGARQDGLTPRQRPRRDPDSGAE